MNHRKAVFWFCIALGVIVGGILGIVTGELLIGALLFGALLGALVFVAIEWVISRRIASEVPYDHLNEHHHVSNARPTQGPEAQLRQIQDGHIDQFMPFQNGKPR
jgi:hypothetical protein